MRMKSYLLSIIFTAVAFLISFGCEVTKTDRVDECIECPVAEPTHATEQQERIEFKGISFTYNPKVLGKISSEEVPAFPLEAADHKPDFVAPKHRRFTFRIAKAGWDEGSIEIYPVKDFPEMFAVDPYQVARIKKELGELRKLLKDKTHRFEGQIPYIPFIDASQSFQSKVQHFEFNEGKGVIFVTYWNTEMALVSNEHLMYIFAGLTNDDKYYVTAEMPISVKFLPETSTEEFEGYHTQFLYEDYETRDSIKPRYRKYIQSISDRIEKLDSNEFRPQLKYFEELISSLKIAD